MAETLPHKVLIISNKPPYPMVDGGCIAMARFEELIFDSFSDISYFALSTPKHPFIEEALPGRWKLNENFFTEFIDTRIRNKHVLKYFTGSSIRASRFYQKSIEEKILQIIADKKVDVIFFESIYSAVYLKYIKKFEGIKVFVRAHNIEHLIWEKYFEKMPRGMKRLAFRSETSRLRTFEENCLHHTDGNIFISENDLVYAKNELKLMEDIYLPVQFKTTEIRPLRIDPDLKLFHIGAMDWLPNREGVENFILHTFPAVLAEFPNIELHLAGKAMPDSFQSYASKNIFIHGEVENSENFIAKFDVLVVPIETGSGIRIKVLEAMAAGKVVISTEAGIDGIPAETGKEFLLAGKADEWIAGVKYLTNKENYMQMSKAGGDLIRKNYSKDALLAQLIPFLKTRINQHV